MQCTDIESSDEREEGEIFEDDLEEISDGSIAPSPKAGKLNSPEENLRAISLSSVSDLEIMECSSVYKSVPKYPRREIRKRKRALRHHHRRSSDSSSENEELIKTKKLLKDAVKTDPDKMLNNSLRTRLKKMVENTLPHNPDLLNNCDSNKDSKDIITSFETPTISNDVVDIETNKECTETDRSSCLPVDGDDELIQLRLEALKTAVINKFQRKKKKLKSDNPEEKKVLDINKENSSDNVNSQSCTSENLACREPISEQNVIVNNGSPNSALDSVDDDEDILRAVLLASMSKKITNKVSSPNEKKNHVNISTLPQQKLVKKSQAAIKPNIDIPKIQPIIISINNPDSESDDAFNDLDCAEKTKDESMINQKQLEMKIDNFLKQQRAEVEAKSTATSISKTSRTVDTLKKNVKVNNLYKLLPENKQLEYEKLIQRLNNVEKKTKAKRLSGRICDNKIQKNKVLLRTTESNSSSIPIPSNIPETLQKQLRHVQHQVNGRLQEKDKSNELTPLLKRLSEVSLEQKKHKLRIKNLMKQLNDARVKSLKLQKVFDELKQEYMKKKEEIDSKTRAVSVTQPRAKVKATTSSANSLQKKNIILQKPNEAAPPKQNVSNAIGSSVQCKVILEKCPNGVKDSRNIVNIKKMEKVEKNDVPKYSSPLELMGSKVKAVAKSQPQVGIQAVPSIENSLKRNVNQNKTNEPESMKRILQAGSSVECKVILEKCLDNLEDPNDNECRIGTKAETTDVPKYSSPLDYRESKNNRIWNPMEILCPFEMDGLCRDKDCTYNHWS